MTAVPRNVWPEGTRMTLTDRRLFRELLRSQRMSYARLGRLADCHRSMISHLAAENSRWTSCSPELALKICDALGVRLDLIFTPSKSTDRRQPVKSGRAA